MYGSEVRHVRIRSQTCKDQKFPLTVHGENIAVVRPVARRLPPPALDERRQAGSPLVPGKLARLLPHKSRMPGRTQDAREAVLSLSRLPSHSH